VSFWGDLVNTIEQAIIANPAGVSNPSPAAGTGVSAVKDASTGQLTAFLGAWAMLTDGKFWRSLGWLLLGVLLMILGALSYIGMGRNPVAIARKAVT
jgi:hypothetical protein